MAKWDYSIKSRIKSINARITVVENRYGRDSDIYKKMVDTVRKAGGNTRFTYSMFTGNLRDIAKATRALEAIENSAYSTAEGRKKIGQKARETFAVRHATYDDSVLENMYFVFKNSSFARLDEIFKYSSELFVDAIMSSFESDSISRKKMVNRVNYFTTHLDKFFEKGMPSRAEAVERFKEYIQKGK